MLQLVCIFFAGNPGCAIFSSDFSPCQKLKSNNQVEERRQDQVLKLKKKYKIILTKFNQK